MGTDTAWASRYTENSHGNSPNPPRSATIDGTAVARIVASTAISAVESIIASSTGPRSERRPTPAVVTAVTNGCKTRRPRMIPPAADLTPLVGPDRRPADGTGGNCGGAPAACAGRVPGMDGSWVLDEKGHA